MYRGGGGCIAAACRGCREGAAPATRGSGEGCGGECRSHARGGMGQGRGEAAGSGRAAAAPEGGGGVKGAAGRDFAAERAAVTGGIVEGGPRAMAAVGGVAATAAVPTEAAWAK